MVHNFKCLLGLVCVSLVLSYSNNLLAAKNSTGQNTKQKIPTTTKQQLLTGQFKQAATELSSLSSSGNSEAQYQLAVLYLNGKGVSKSISKATKLLNLSSASGNKKAKRLLGKLSKNKLTVTDATQGAFLKAIQKNDLKKIKALANKGIDVNRIDKAGSSPLIVAVKHQRLEIVQWLIQQPTIIVSKQDRKGNTALHAAAESNQLKVLIALVSTNDNSTKDLEILNVKKQTPLHFAVINGHKKTAQWLVSRKLNADLKDVHGKTAKDYARSNSLSITFENNSNDNKKIDTKFLKQQTKHQLNALSKQAADKESIHYQWPILLIAITQKQSQLSKQILQSGADPWQTNPAGESAFTLALATEQLGLVNKMLALHPTNAERSRQSINDLFALAIHKNNVHLVDKLLVLIRNKSNFDINNPLIEAIKSDSPKVVGYLLEQTADVPTGEMLHLATTLNYVAVAATILLKKPPINWQDTKGRSALWLAADNGNQELLSLYILFNADIDSSDNNGQTALMRATIKKCITCVKVLLEKKANPSKVSNTGNTSVMFAAQYSDEILKLFMDKDIDLSERNNQTLTPLMLAIKNKNIASVRTLLEADANPRRRNENGQNAFELAVNQPEMLLLLEKY